MRCDPKLAVGNLNPIPLRYYNIGAMRIVKAPAEILSKSTQKVAKYDSQLRNLVDTMAAAMRQAKGIGLSANQIGAPWQVMVIEVLSDGLKIPLTVIVNPKLVNVSAQQSVKIEGCLSLPGKEVEVPRAQAIKIKGYNLKGKKITIAAKGLLARIIQHEYDHLNGLLITDRGKVVRPHQ